MSEGLSPVLHRIGVIGDVHGEDAALEVTLAFLKNAGNLDAILCTGDLPGKMGVGDTARCCALLQANGVLTIRGNHDRWAVEMVDDAFVTSLNDERSLSSETLDFLATLPKTREFETPLGSLLLCHGIGNNDMEGVYPGGEDETIRDALKRRRIYGWHRVMIAGHIHERMLRRIGSILIINPGTLLWNKDPGFLIVDFDDALITVYHLKPFVNEITEAQVVPLLAYAGEERTEYD